MYLFYSHSREQLLLCTRWRTGNLFQRWVSDLKFLDSRDAISAVAERLMYHSGAR